MWPRWLSDALGGKASLSRAFWLYGFGVSVAYSVVGLFIDIENRVGLIAYLVIGTVLGVLQTIILWRCAANSRSKFLGRLVRTAVVFGLAMVAVMLYVLFVNSDLLLPPKDR